MRHRKDYVVVALILRAQYQEAQQYALDVPSADGVQVVESITAHLADSFAADNIRFDRDQFFMSALGHPERARKR